VDVLLKTGDESDQHFQLSGGNTGQDLPSRFTDDGFHLSDNRGRFFRQFDPLGATVAGAGLSGDESLLFQLVKGT